MQTLELARDLISKTNVWIAALCVGALLCTSSSRAWPLSTGVIDDLSLDVLRLPSDVDNRERTLLWAVLRNRRDRARVMCVAGWGYAQLSVRGQSAAQTSPHACGSLDSFRIVAANETLYWPIMLPVDAPPVDNKLRLEVTIVEREIHSPQQHVDHDLSWEGTLAKASSDARKLFRQ